MKTIIKSLLLVFVFGAFLACEKADLISSSAENDLSQVDNEFNKNLKSFSGHSTRTILYLDGIDDYIQVPDHSSLDMMTSFTISAWVYLDSYVEWASVVTKGGVEDDQVESYNNYTLHQSGHSAGGGEYGHIRFTNDCLALPFLESYTIMSRYEWHFVTVTYDATYLRFYLDGNPDGTMKIYGPLCANDQPLNIGADFPGGNEYWHGAIDELRIWNVALTDEQVIEALDGNGRLLAKNLVGYWHFNEGSGNVLHDYSGFGNHGTIMGGAVWLH